MHSHRYLGLVIGVQVLHSQPHYLVRNQNIYIYPIMYCIELVAILLHEIIAHTYDVLHVPDLYIRQTSENLT